MPREAPSGAPCGIFVSASSRGRAPCTPVSPRDKTARPGAPRHRASVPTRKTNDGSEENSSTQDWPQRRNRPFHHGRRGAPASEDAYRPDAALPLPLSPRPGGSGLLGAAFCRSLPLRKNTIFCAKSKIQTPHLRFFRYTSSPWKRRVIRERMRPTPVENLQQAG